MSERVANTYELLERIAQGSVASVWRGVLRSEAGLSRPVCVRALEPPWDHDGPTLGAWASIASELASHGGSHVEQMFDIAFADGRALVVTEWIDGTSVARWLEFHVDQHDGVPWQLAVAVAVEALRGLVGPHACTPPLCHEGIGVHTVRIARDGTVKLIRFGLASALAVRGVAHRRLEELGVRTSAPELLSGGAASIGSDLFAVGALLYEMIAGRPPFEAPIGETRDAQIDATEPPDLSVVRDVPPLLVSLVERALRREPSERFESASAMIRALSQLLRTEMEPSSPEAVAASVAATFGPRIARPKGIPDQRTMHVELEELTVMPTIVVGDAGEAQLLDEPDSLPGLAEQPSEAEALPLTRRSRESIAQLNRAAGLMPQKTEFLDDALVDRLTMPEGGLSPQRTEMLDPTEVDRLTLPDAKKKPGQGGG